jgi:hypothetical protein
MPQGVEVKKRARRPLKNVGEPIEQIVKLLDQMSRILESMQFQINVQRFGHRQIESRLTKLERAALRGLVSARKGRR